LTGVFCIWNGENNKQSKYFCSLKKGYFWFRRMSDAKDVLLNYVVPSLGLILAYVLFASPYKEVMRIYKEQKLNSFDLLPYSLMTVQCVGWCVYARGMSGVSAFFEFFTNWMGVVWGGLIIGVGFPYASEKVKRNIVLVFQAFLAIYLPFVFLVDSLAKPMRQQILGPVSIFLQLLFFSSPLRQAIEIIRIKSAKSIYWPLALTSTVCTGLWTLYGITIGDASIAAPNGLSCVFGAMQMALVLIYRNSGVVEIRDSQADKRDTEEMHEIPKDD
jgi:solute carrier family 50 protein (sugar transporter)